MIQDRPLQSFARLMLVGLLLAAAPWVRAQECIEYDEHLRWLMRHDSPQGYVVTLATRGNLVVTAHEGNRLAFHTLMPENRLEELATLSLAKNPYALALTATDLHVLAGNTPTRLYSIDVGDPSAPVLLDSLDVAPWCYNMAQDGDYLYCARWDSLSILDTSAAGLPTRAAVHAWVNGEPEDYCVQGGLLTLIGTSKALEIYDVSDPEQFVPRGAIDELDPWPYRVTAVGDQLVTFRGYWDGGATFLTVIDAANPDAPTPVGEWNCPPDWSGGGSLYGTCADGDLLLVGLRYEDLWDSYNGLLVFDFSDPSAPALSAELAAGTEMTDAVALGGGRHLVNFGYGGVCLLDASWPTPATPAGSSGLGEIYGGLATLGDLAYVARVSGGLRVIDVADPAAPALVTTLSVPGYGQRVRREGDRAYLAYGTHLNVVDLSVPRSPTLLGSLPLGACNDVAVADTLAYIASFTDGLRVVSVADPAAMAEVGYLDTPGAANGIALRGTVAYLADYNGGLRVIDVSDPHSPQPISALSALLNAVAIALHGDYAYVACLDRGLRVLDISDPAAPVVLPARPLWMHQLKALTVHGNYLYVVDAGAGLLVFDISDPAQPLPIGLVPQRTNEGGTHSPCGVAISANGQVCFTLHTPGLLVAGWQCDPTAVWLSDFSIESEPGRVRLSWEVGTDEAAAPDLRLAVAGPTGQRELSFHFAGGRYLAVDDSPLLAAGGEFVYNLSGRSDGEWQLLRSESVSMPALTPRLRLAEPWPNPFNPHTLLSVETSHAARVELAIYDAAGRRVALLHEGILAAGRHEFVWDGRDGAGRSLASGVYLARLAGPASLESRKLLLLR